MWIFTQHGFYSAVCARQGDGRKSQPVDTGRIMIRARLREHLVNLMERFPRDFQGCEIVTSSDTDYAYRVFVTKTVWSAVLAKLADETEYDNFKSAVGRQQGTAGTAYLDALHDVWEVMNRLQK